jgi:RNA polymerase sigma-70 factor (ECF subfamily)
MVVMVMRWSHRKRSSIDAQGLDLLYRQNSRRLLAFLTSRLDDPEDAVDCLAETFLQAYQSRRSFRGSTDDDAAGWLFGIARNVLLMHVRAARPRRAALDDRGFERRALTDDEFDRIDEMRSSRDLREAIKGAMNGLAPTQREAVWMRVVEERSYSEIASSQGITEQAARTRVSRGLRTLMASVPAPAGSGKD